MQYLTKGLLTGIAPSIILPEGSSLSHSSLAKVARDLAFPDAILTIRGLPGSISDRSHALTMWEAAKPELIKSVIC